LETGGAWYDAAILANGYILMTKFSLGSSFAHRILPAVLLGAAVLLISISGRAQDSQAADDSDPVKIFNLGQEAHEKGDFAAAIKFYDDAIKIVPEFPEAEYQRAAAYLSLNKIPDAERGFRRALELRPDWTLAMVSLGSLLVSEGRFEEAGKLLDGALALDGQNYPALVALAELRLKTRASPQSLQDLLAKLRIATSKANPTPSAWAARAAIERSLGDTKGAADSVARAVAIDPRNSFALVERIELSLAASDFNRAAEDAQFLVKLNPNDSNRLLLARVLARAGRDVEALKIIDSVDHSNKDAADLRKALSARSTTDPEVLKKQLASDPNNIDLLANLCSLTRTASPREALDFCRRAAAIEPDNITYAVGYGAALVQAKQFEQAAGLLRKLLTVAPDNYTIHLNLATSLYELKRYPDAKTEYLWITEHNPGNPIGFYFLAIVFDSMGGYMDAAANYQQFLRFADPAVNELEIEKVKLRLSVLEKLTRQKDKGKHN
jgi:tetratricopeptide (TPR) repeat protein